MAACTNCHAQFHACGSCGLSDWEWDFCSERCLHEHQRRQLPAIAAKYGLTYDRLYDLVQELDGHYPHLMPRTAEHA